MWLPRVVWQEYDRLILISFLMYMLQVQPLKINSYARKDWNLMTPLLYYTRETNVMTAKGNVQNAHKKCITKLLVENHSQCYR